MVILDNAFASRRQQPSDYAGFKAPPKIIPMGGPNAGGPGGLGPKWHHLQADYMSRLPPVHAQQ